MKSFEFRGYEFHSPRMWQQNQVDMALDFMAKYNLNALIFHENDIISQLVFPEKYFSNDIMWDYWPTRRQGILYRREYIAKVIRSCKRKGIQFFLEVKELDVIDSIFEVVKELRQPDGAVCPNNSFWKEFLSAKLEELFTVLPGISGIIVSLGTRESAVSTAANRCKCDLCRNTTDLQWYISMLKTMYEVTNKFGKELIVRDFAFSRDQQELMLKACEKISDRIIFSIKAEPHDYYPTFPINPLIGNTGNMREYIEFDTWGQFFGMGVSPMSVVEDIEERLRYSYEKGATGVWFRTDWELMPDASTHCTPSLVNLYAGAMLSSDLDTPIDSIYKTWIDEGLYSPMYQASIPQNPEHPKNPDAWKYFRDYMKASWKAFEKSGYIQGTQFLESDQAPYTVEKAFEIMLDIHSKEDWAPGSNTHLVVTKENMVSVFKEKKEGVAETKKLERILDIDNLGVSVSFAEDMKTTIQCQVLYSELCEIITRSMYLSMWAKDTRKEEDIDSLKATINELEDIATRIENSFVGTDFPYYLYARLNPERIRKYKHNVEDHLNAL